MLEAVDGRRTYEQVADAACGASGRLVSADDVRTLAQARLWPLGLLALADGAQPRTTRTDPLLGLRLR